MGSERPDLGSGRPNLGFERPDLRSARSDLGSERPDMGSERPYLRLAGGGDGQTENGNWRKLPYVESQAIGPSGAAPQKGG